MTEPASTPLVATWLAFASGGSCFLGAGYLAGAGLGSTVATPISLTLAGLVLLAGSRVRLKTIKVARFAAVGLAILGVGISTLLVASRATALVELESSSAPPTRAPGGFPRHDRAQVVEIPIGVDLENIGRITTDGETLYFVGASRTPTFTDERAKLAFIKSRRHKIYALPVSGGVARPLYHSRSPQKPVLLGERLFWIDPNGGEEPYPTQILWGSRDGSAPVQTIYEGVGPPLGPGQPIVDGSSLATDQRRLYTADYVQGRVHVLNPDGSDLAQLGPQRYGGLWETQQVNAIAVEDGLLYIVNQGQGDILPRVDSIPTQGDTFTTLHSFPKSVRPVDIAVGRSAIFVADETGRVWRLPKKGGKPQELPVPGLASPQGLALHGDILFVTDRAGRGPKWDPVGRIFRVAVLP